jgi:hypothetical protein
MEEHEIANDDSIFRPGCEEAQEALQRLFDGVGDWDSPEAQLHRTLCGDCREEYSLFSPMSRALARGSVVVPASLVDRLNESVERAQRRGRWQKRFAYVGGGMAVAASLWLTLWVVQPTEQLVVQQSISPSVAQVDEPARPLAATVVDARDAVTHLLGRAANETVDSTAGLVPMPNTSFVAQAPTGLQPLSEAQEGLARSVEPIAGSARRALNLFMNAAPPARPNLQ